MWSVAWFPARALPVVTGRCVFVCVCVYIYIYIYMIILAVSSPYLLVFGNDRVCSTQKQRMLQVDLVRHRAEVGARLGGVLPYFIMFLNKL